MSNRIVDFDKFGINKFTIPTWENRKMPISPPESVEEYYRWVNDEGYLHTEVEITGFGDRKLTMIIGNQVKYAFKDINGQDVSSSFKTGLDSVRNFNNCYSIIVFKDGALVIQGRAYIVTKTHLHVIPETYEYDVYLEY